MSAAEAQLEALFQNKSREVQAVRTSLNEEKLRLAAEIAASLDGGNCNSSAGMYKNDEA